MIAYSSCAAPADPATSRALEAVARAAAAEMGRAAAGALELPPEPPEWIVLMRGGPVEARDGRRWRLDDPEAAAAATRARMGPTDLVIDYEHQASHAPQNGQPAPAAGWIRELRAAAGALEARVEWTARARGLLAAREYRYISPWFLHERGRVTALLGAGLTNTPALDLPALAREDADVDERLNRALAALGLAEGADAAAVDAAAARIEAQRAPLARLRAALGVPDDGDDAALAAAAEQAAGAADLAARVRSALGLAADAGADAVVAAAGRRAPDPGQHVPRAEFDRVARSLQELQAAQAEAAAVAAVDEAVAGGRLAPAQREWALGYARQDLAGFQAFAADAPVIAGAAAPGASRPPAADAALAADEREVARRLGVTEDQFREARARDLAAREER